MYLPLILKRFYARFIFCYSGNSDLIIKMHKLWGGFMHLSDAKQGHWHNLWIMVGMFWCESNHHLFFTMQLQCLNLKWLQWHIKFWNNISWFALPFSRNTIMADQALIFPCWSLGHCIQRWGGRQIPDNFSGKRCCSWYTTWINFTSIRQEVLSFSRKPTELFYKTVSDAIHLLYWIYQWYYSTRCSENEFFWGYLYCY